MVSTLAKPLDSPATVRPILVDLKQRFSASSVITVRRCTGSAAPRSAGAMRRKTSCRTRSSSCCSTFRAAATVRISVPGCLPSRPTPAATARDGECAGCRGARSSSSQMRPLSNRPISVAPGRRCARSRCETGCCCRCARRGSRIGTSPPPPESGNSRWAVCSHAPSIAGNVVSKRSRIDRNVERPKRGKECHMRCPTEAELQAVVDNEAAETAGAHAVSCSSRRGRIEERRRQMAELNALMAINVPATVETRLRVAVASGGRARGHALRRSAAPSPWRPAAWLSAAATAAVVALIVFLILPRFGAPTSLSAARILGRSLETLSDARRRVARTISHRRAVGGAASRPTPDRSGASDPIPVRELRPRRPARVGDQPGPD